MKATMKQVLLFISIILSINIYAQDIDSDLVIKKGDNYLTYTRAYMYNSELIEFAITGVNPTYQYITDIITVFVGDPNDTYEYLRSVYKFLQDSENKKQAARVYEDYTFTKSRYLGSTRIGLHHDGKMLSFKESEIKAFCEKFIEYCKENNIQYR